jgi:methionyl-tRNA formyltransferase
MKIVFMGTPEFAVPLLEELFKSEHNVTLIVTQPDKPNRRGNKIDYSPVKKMGKKYLCPIFQPVKVKEQESIKKILREKADVIVVSAYGQILPTEILEGPKYGCINIHASLLPEYRGAAPIHRAIINGEKKTGISIMKMDQGLDTGDVYKTIEFPINEDTTVGEMHDLMAQSAGELLLEVLNELENGEAVLTQQNNEKSTYAPMLDKQVGKINWHQNIVDIRNRINGTDPYPGAYTKYNGKKIKVFKPEIVDALECNDENEFGRLLSADLKDGLSIQCKGGVLRIKELQYPGKKRMSTVEFLKGNSLDVGIVLQ